jgi:hypothetical protein
MHTEIIAFLIIGVVFCVMRLIAVPLPPCTNPFAVKINNNENNNNNNNYYYHPLFLTESFTCTWLLFSFLPFHPYQILKHFFHLKDKV